MDNHYYPVLCDGTWITTAVATPESDFSVSILGYIKADVNPNSEIALVYDNNNLYLYTNGSYSVLFNNNTNTEGRISLNTNFKSQIIPETTSLSILGKINITNTWLTQKYLPVTELRQQGQACWANCLRSMRLWYSVDKSIAQIYSSAGKTQYEYVNLSTAVSVAQNLLGFDTTTISYPTTLKYSTLKNYIDSDKPIYAEVNMGSYSSHAILIRVYYTYSYSETHMGSIAYMDPATGSYGATGFKKMANISTRALTELHMTLDIIL